MNKLPFDAKKSTHGLKPIMYFHKCPTCNGTGTVSWSPGKKDGGICHLCNGRGSWTNWDKCTGSLFIVIISIMFPAITFTNRMYLACCLNTLLWMCLDSDRTKASEADEFYDCDFHTELVK